MHAECGKDTRHDNRNQTDAVYLDTDGICRMCIQPTGLHMKTERRAIYEDRKQYRKNDAHIGQEIMTGKNRTEYRGYP